MLAFFFIIYDLPTLYVIIWIIVGIIFIALGLYLLIKKRKQSLHEAVIEVEGKEIIDMALQSDEKTSKNIDRPGERIDIFLKNMVIDFFFLIAQILVQPTTNAIFDSLQTGLNWSIATFAVLFSLLTPLFFMFIFVKHSYEIKRKLWRDEYQFYLENSNSATASLVKTMKYSYEWFPIYELALRLVYSVTTNFNWAISWISPCFGTIIMLFFFLTILSINPFRYTSQYVTYLCESFILFVCNAIGWLQESGRLNPGYFTTGFQIVMYISIALSFVASLMCFIFIDERRIESLKYKTGLIRGWNKNPNLIKKNLDGGIMKYLFLICSFVNLIGMILFYATIPYLGDFQYEGSHLL